MRNSYYKQQRQFKIQFISRFSLGRKSIQYLKRAKFIVGGYWAQRIVNRENTKA